MINAGKGTAGPDMRSILKSVRYLDEQLQVKEEKVEALELGYRSSKLKGKPDIVLEADFTLENTDEPESIQSRMKAILAVRKAKFPLNYPNAGSVFKQPDGFPPAGWLIEQAGLKGRRIGNAQISVKHANFIINLGGASSSDVKELVLVIQEAVYKVHGVMLEREVIYWPEETNWKAW